MRKKMMVIDVDECTGCDLCIIACKDEHVGSDHLPWALPQPDTGHFWIGLDSQERGQTPKVKVTHIPMICMHCDNAPCMKSCPENAIAKREDGLVWISPELCTGCGLCKDACPYDVIYMNDEAKVAQKCTWCAHLVDGGGKPRCAEICPRDAIIFGDEDDPRILEFKEKLEPVHPEFGARPRVLYKGLPRPFIAGTVFDPVTDEAISGVKVTVRDLFNDSQTVVHTDEFGDFWVLNLTKDHRYLLTSEKSNFEAKSLVVTADRDRNVGDLPMKRAKS